MDRPIVSTVFGTLGAVCWSIQLIPQVILNYKRHSAAGLSAAFMLSWAWAGIPLGVFNIVSGFSIALQIQPQILTTLSLITWGQCCYYEKKWKWQRVTVLVLLAGLVMGGIETGLVFALRHGVARGIHWPVTLMAVLAAILLVLGVGEQYVAIFKTRSVEGISFFFCGLDAMGDLTSIISVIYGPTLDILGLVVYAAELTCWMGIFALGFYFKLWPSMRQMLSTARSETHTAGRRYHGEAQQTGVQLHELPSSTSVFRVARSDHSLRSRGQATLA